MLLSVLLFSIHCSRSACSDCCCFHPGRPPGMISVNKMFKQRWLAWEVTTRAFLLEGYSITANGASSMLNEYDMRKILVSYYVKVWSRLHFGHEHGGYVRATDIRYQGWAEEMFKTALGMWLHRIRFLDMAVILRNMKLHCNVLLYIFLSLCLRSTFNCNKRYNSIVSFIAIAIEGRAWVEAKKDVWQSLSLQRTSTGYCDHCVGALLESFPALKDKKKCGNCC